MSQRVLGLIVAGGGGAPSLPLGGPGEPALTPFAGTYHFIDFALATLRNSGVRDVHVAAPAPAGSLRRYLQEATLAPRPSILTLPPPTGDGRIVRLRAALRAAAPLLTARRPDAVVILLADHILLLDLRPLLHALMTGDADALLPALPLPAEDIGTRLALPVDADQRVRSDPQTTAHGVALTWAGDAVLHRGAVDALVAAPEAADDDAMVAAFAARVRVHAYNVRENHVPGTAAGGAYWHEPMTLEAYYGAQMELCTGRSPLDLYNPLWPMPTAARRLAPAKVMTDSIGRAGQALDTLVSDGSVIRGAVVVKSVLGQGVVVESGAEVEDSLLLDGCRIGSRARIRRAVIGPGAVIADDEEIGYGAEPAAPRRLLRSGLTLVPSRLPD